MESVNRHLKYMCSLIKTIDYSLPQGNTISCILHPTQVHATIVAIVILWEGYARVNAHVVQNSASHDDLACGGRFKLQDSTSSVQTSVSKSPLALCELTLQCLAIMLTL